MDVGLPDLDGREAVRQLRRDGYRRPIIMLTAHDSDADTVTASNSGANDYVGKPFRFVVLLARIRAQLRQYEASEDAEFQVGPYTFRPTSKNLVDAQGRQAAADREGGGDPALPAPRRSAAGAARDAAEARLGLQLQRHHPHARNPYLPPPAEDRGQSGGRPASRHRGRRLQAAGVPRRAEGAPGDARRRRRAAGADPSVQPDAARGGATDRFLLRQDSACGRARRCSAAGDAGDARLFRPVGRDPARGPSARSGPLSAGRRPER